MNVTGMKSEKVTIGEHTLSLLHTHTKVSFLNKKKCSDHSTRNIGMHYQEAKRVPYNWQCRCHTTITPLIMSIKKKKSAAYAHTTNCKRPFTKVPVDVKVFVCITKFFIRHYPCVCMYYQVLHNVLQRGLWAFPSPSQGITKVFICAMLIFLCKHTAFLLQVLPVTLDILHHQILPSQLIVVREVTYHPKTQSVIGEVAYHSKTHRQWLGK